jgi:hypothetical protein
MFPTPANTTDIAISIGAWHALYYDYSSDAHPYQPFCIETFKPAETQPDDGVFAFTGNGGFPAIGLGWSLSGTCRPKENDQEKLSVTWISKYSDGYDDEYFSGTYDRSTMRIDGTAGPGPDVDEHEDIVVLSQQPADVIIYRPHPTVLTNPEIKISALWQFAKDAILHQVRKRMWSWSYFRARRDNRTRYLDLAQRFFRLYYWQPQELLRVKRKLFISDQVYLVSLVQKMSYLKVHVYVLSCLSLFAPDY